MMPSRTPVQLRRQRPRRTCIRRGGERRGHLNPSGKGRNSVAPRSFPVTLTTHHQHRGIAMKTITRIAVSTTLGLTVIAACAGEISGGTYIEAYGAQNQTFSDGAVAYQTIG